MEAKILYPRGFVTADWALAQWGRALVVLCFIAVQSIGAVALLASPASAQARNVYEVRAVAVDVSAETAAAARGKALVQGEALAMQRLLRRMTLKSDYPRLPQLAPEEIREYIQDFSVADEKTSSVRYLAHLTYRFRAGEVRELLRAFNVSFAETPSKPVLVLPILQQAGAQLLWDDPNPWRAAWQQRSDSESLVPVLLPLGDLSDVASIGVEQALQGDQQRLQAVAKRYDAGSTAVAFAKLRIDPAKSRFILDVNLTRFNITIDPQTTVITYVAEFGETAESLLSRAAAEVTQLIEDNWKRDNLLQSGQREAIAVHVPIASLKQWLGLRKKLGGVAVIREIELVLLSLGEAQVILHYIGDVGQLIIALEQADLALRGDGDAWTLETLDQSGKPRQ